MSDDKAPENESTALRSRVARWFTPQLSRHQSKKTGPPKKPQKPPTDSDLEDEFFRLADRMGEEPAVPDWEAGRHIRRQEPLDEKHTQGRQKLWRELEWEAEQRARKSHPSGRSGSKSAGKSRQGDSKKKAA